MHTLEFKMEFQASDQVSLKETLVYLPASLYGQGRLEVQTSDGTTVYDAEVSV